MDDKAVFINCPFDPGYQDHLWGLAFCILESRFTPQLALDVASASFGQFEKIKKQIANCRFTIHDLSRTKTPRFNMPLELGFALGLEFAEISGKEKSGKNGKDAKKQAGTERLKVDGRRQTLVICEDPDNLKQVASDLKGVEVHDYNSTRALVRTVARWLRPNRDKSILVPDPEVIAGRFDHFWQQINDQAPRLGKTPSDFPWDERCELVLEYMEACPPMQQDKIRFKPTDPKD